MASVTPSVLPAQWSIADVLSHLGDIPLDRIRAVPPPGTATEADVLEAESRTGRICELVDGVLVEKAMGYDESLVAMTLGRLLGQYAEDHGLGVVLGEAGTLRILPNLVRIPDVSFIGWEKFPNRELPEEPIPAVAPDLAVEVLSEKNTPAEMRRRLREYFQAGVRLVWYLDPKTRTAEVYTSLEARSEIGESDVLDGGDVLPGFTITLAELFARAEGRRPE